MSCMPFAPPAGNCGEPTAVPTAFICAYRLNFKHEFKLICLKHAIAALRERGEKGRMPNKSQTVSDPAKLAFTSRSHREEDNLYACDIIASRSQLGEIFKSNAVDQEFL